MLRLQEIPSTWQLIVFFNSRNSVYFSCITILCGGHNWSLGLWSGDSGMSFHKMVGEFLIGSLGEHSLCLKTGGFGQQEALAKVPWAAVQPWLICRLPGSRNRTLSPGMGQWGLASFIPLYTRVMAPWIAIATSLELSLWDHQDWSEFPLVTQA